jgi:hypothetical protein
MAAAAITHRRLLCQRIPRAFAPDSKPDGIVGFYVELLSLHSVFGSRCILCEASLAWPT